MEEELKCEQCGYEGDRSFFGDNEIDEENNDPSISVCPKCHYIVFQKPREKV